MKTLIVPALMIACASALAAPEQDTRCFELRVYTAAPGKLDALSARFRDHSCALFTKHGFTNIGYWVPAENEDNKFYYMIASPNREAHDAAWQAFFADPEWKKVFEESEADGKLVEKGENYFLTATDFSPAIAPSANGEPRLLELRTYTPAPQKLDALLARFRDHTVGLFEKHGMINVAYWTEQEKEDGKLIYLLGHTNKEAAEKSFSAFRADPDWVAAKKASEVDGSLTENVESVFLVPLDYSPIK